MTPERKAELRARHVPMPEEIELWADQEYHERHDAEFPECSQCEGHMLTIQVCQECGYDHDGETPTFREWPCPTSTDIAELLAENDALEAQRDELEQLRDQSRLLGHARMVLDRCAEGMAGPDEAADMAQRIVDLIGHPVTDEPPHALVRIDALEDEAESLADECARLTEQRDVLDRLVRRLMRPPPLRPELLLDDERAELERIMGEK